MANKSDRPIVIGGEVVERLGPVLRGGIPVASDVLGYAMVSNDSPAGAVIPQALQDFLGQQGIIKATIRKL